MWLSLTLSGKGPGRIYSEMAPCVSGGQEAVRAKEQARSLDVNSTSNRLFEQKYPLSERNKKHFLGHVDTRPG